MLHHFLSPCEPEYTSILRSVQGIAGDVAPKPPNDLPLSRRKRSVLPAKIALISRVKRSAAAVGWAACLRYYLDLEHIFDRHI